jgi:hypothetical protein
MSNPIVDQNMIDDMNEVIAIFDGYQFRKGDPNHKCNFCFAGDEPCAPAVDRFIKDCRVYFHFELKYHSSWDCLMPVVEKIRKLIHAEEDGDIRKLMSQRYAPIENELRNINRTNVHYCVYQFIQWYNKVKEDRK